MTPRQIKSQLILVGVTQAEIARRAGNVSNSHVAKVINRQSISAPVEKQIAAAINLPLSVVFPDRYGKQRKTVDRLAS